MRMTMAFCASTGLPGQARVRRAATCGSRRTLCSAAGESNAVHVGRRELLRAAALTGAAAILGSGAVPAEALNKKRMLAKAGPATELPGGILYRDITVGKGSSPRNGDTVAIHYSLFYNDFEVESSRESQGLAASPIGFTYGARTGPGSILKGLNDGMEGMKVGGLRIITVPSELAYGSVGKSPMIPPDSTVEFAVSLLSCKRAGSNPNSMINPNSQVF